MTSHDQHHTLYVGQDAVIDITVTTDAANIDGWTMAGYYRHEPSNRLDMTVPATVPTPGSKVARLTITDTLSDALVPGRYLFQFWRTDADSESPLAEGIVTVKASARTG